MGRANTPYFSKKWFEIYKKLLPNNKIFAKIKLHNSSNTCWVIKRSRIFVFRFCFASLYRVSSKICSKNAVKRCQKLFYKTKKFFVYCCILSLIAFHAEGDFYWPGKFEKKLSPAQKLVSRQEITNLIDRNKSNGSYPFQNFRRLLILFSN